MSDRVSFRKCLFHKIDDTIFCSERTIKIKLNSLLTHSCCPEPNIFKLILSTHQYQVINFVVNINYQSIWVRKLWNTHEQSNRIQSVVSEHDKILIFLSHNKYYICYLKHLKYKKMDSKFEFKLLTLKKGCREFNLSPNCPFLYKLCTKINFTTQSNIVLKDKWRSRNSRTAKV